MVATILMAVAWLFRSGEVRDEDRVVLTQAPSPSATLPFSDALPQFGDPTGAAAPLVATGPVARSGTLATLIVETPMTESRLRMVTHADIARMKAAGIGMDVQPVVTFAESGFVQAGEARTIGDR